MGCLFGVVGRCWIRLRICRGTVDRMDGQLVKERPFVCDVCGAKFNRRSTLWNHRRIHSESRPFICTICNHRFKWKNSLKCHRAMHARRGDDRRADGQAELDTSSREDGPVEKVELEEGEEMSVLELPSLVSITCQRSPSVRQSDSPGPPQPVPAQSPSEAYYAKVLPSHMCTTPQPNTLYLTAATAKICHHISYRFRDFWRYLLCVTSSAGSSSQENSVGNENSQAPVRRHPSADVIDILDEDLDDLSDDVERAWRISQRTDSWRSAASKRRRRRAAPCSRRKGITGRKVVSYWRPGMGTTISVSSPEPEDRNVVEKAWHILCQKPLRMGSMLRLSRLVSDASGTEKVLLASSGVIQRILDMIDERSHMGATASASLRPSKHSPQSQQELAGGRWPSKAPRNNFVTQITTGGRRKSNAGNPTRRGVGYGFGSTRSQWDLERTIEQNLANEEQQVWLINSLTAYVFCANPDFHDAEEAKQMASERECCHITRELVASMDGSSIVPMLQYHLKNESIFDISEHMEFYQALLELAASMCLFPALAELLVYPHGDDAVAGDSTAVRSICSHLLPQFRDQLLAYLSSPAVRMGSPDFRLIDFIHRVQKWCDVAAAAAETASNNARSRRKVVSTEEGTAEHSRTEQTRTVTGAVSASSSGLTVSSISSTNANEPTPAAPVTEPDSTNVDQHSDDTSTKRAVDYRNALKPLQINTWKFIGDFGKLVVPFTYRKEAKSLNPFSPSLKERTKRIARELASLHNSLPLNLSNSIFIAVDEGRCDIMKVLITGPEDTPYQNGCFEFDLFFPSGYPFSPPKLSFLTTANGEVRFNPNLYQDGKVCLSILNTWEGRPEEKWNPYCSLLQVLISVQALVFVKEPYFNEPGFERYIGTEKGQHLSNAYNQQLQHATLHYAILEQLKQPPEYFKDVVLRHFWMKKESIREQAQLWLRNVQADAAAFAKEREGKKGGGSSSASAAAAALDSGLGVVSVRGMERTVEMLEQELAQLTRQD